MRSERQDVSSVLSQLHDKTDGWANVYRWGRLIIEIRISWLGDHKGTFVLFHFLLYCFTIFYFILFMHSNQNLTEGKCILFGPESKHLKWRKNLHFLTLSSHRPLFVVTPWWRSAGILSWRVPHTLGTSFREYFWEITGTSPSCPLLSSLQDSNVLLESRVHCGLFSSEMCMKSRARKLNF